MYTNVFGSNKNRNYFHCLDKGATYEFRVQAVNENGDGHRAVQFLDIPDGGRSRYRTSRNLVGTNSFGL